MAGAEVMNLQEFIDKGSMECLNQDDNHPISNAMLQGGDDTYVQSDTDQQLLVRIQFNQAVKINAIAFKGTGEEAPQSVKLFKEQLSIGFGEAEDAEAVQDLVLSQEDVEGGKQIPLRFVKFQSVQSLQIFVSENFGADVTRINRIELFGMPAQNMDMKQFKPVKG